MTDMQISRCRLADRKSMNSTPYNSMKIANTNWFLFDDDQYWLSDKVREICIFIIWFNQRCLQMARKGNGICLLDSIKPVAEAHKETS